MDIQNSSSSNFAFPSYFTEKKYLIIGHQVDNLGDIACAVKVANLIHRRFHVPQEQITITSNQPELVQFFNKYQFKVVSYQEALMRSEDDLLIAAPASAPDAGRFLKLGKPIVCVNEYDYKTNRSYDPYSWIHWASFGLGPNTIGILINRKLAKTGFVPDLSMTPERMQFLEKIDPVLKKGLLGERSMEEFSHSHALYVSYTSQANLKLAFIQAIVALNKDENKNLIFISPGTERRGITPELLSKFLKNGSFSSISGVQLYCYIYSEKKFDSTFLIEQLDPRGSKTLTVICGSFHHQDLKKLLAYSEKEMVATGDQSISEGISSNKSWLYEYLSHKKTFADQLNSRSFNQTQESLLLTSDTWSLMYETFNRRKVDQYQQMTKTNCLLKDRDCTSTFAKLIEKALTPSTAPALIHIDSNKEPLTPENLPLETPVLIALSQICALNIDTSTLESSLPIFKGSVFKVLLVEADNKGLSYLTIRSLKDKS